MEKSQKTNLKTSWIKNTLQYNIYSSCTHTYIHTCMCMINRMYYTAPLLLPCQWLCLQLQQPSSSHCCCQSILTFGNGHQQRTFLGTFHVKQGFIRVCPHRCLSRATRRCLWRRWGWHWQHCAGRQRSYDTSRWCWGWWGWNRQPKCNVHVFLVCLLRLMCTQQLKTIFGLLHVFRHLIGWIMRVVAAGCTAVVATTVAS